MGGWHSQLYSAAARYMVVAHEILVTAQRPSSFFPFLDLTWAWTLDWDLAMGLSIVCVEITILHINNKFMVPFY